MDVDPEAEPLLLVHQVQGDFSFVDISDVPVYPLLHKIRQDLKVSTYLKHPRHRQCVNLSRHVPQEIIDTSLTWEQLTSPRVVFSVVKPLQEKYVSIKNPSLIYCLLTNRFQFMNEQQNQSSYSVNATRAALCELLAARIFREIEVAHEDAGESEMLLLAQIMVTGFHPFQGAPPECEMQGDDLDDESRTQCALEVGVSLSSEGVFG